MDMGLNGRAVLVTGGSGAIGRAIATAFAVEGARVAVGWHSAEGGAADVVRGIADASGEAMAVRLDQGDPASIAAAVDAVVGRWGAVDVVVGNAVSWPYGEQDWDGLVGGLTVNVAGTATVVESALPGMRARGWGRVVLVSTDIVEQPMAGPVTYPAAKAAVEAAARVLAVREARHGVLVNVVRPGFTLTQRALDTPWLGQDAVDAESARTPTARICTPEDIATSVVYLGSAANSHINGEVVSISGGRHLTR